MTPEHKKRLDAAAAFSGKSQSQEAENLIDFAFDREDLLTDVLRLAYGRQVASILQMLGSALLHSGFNALLSAAGGPLADDKVDFTKWIDDPDAYEQAKQSVVAILERLRPEGQISNPHGQTGKYVAEEIIRTVSGQNRPDKDGYTPVPAYSFDPETVHRNLGPIASRLVATPPTSQRCPLCDQSLVTDQADHAEDPQSDVAKGQSGSGS